MINILSPGGGSAAHSSQNSKKIPEKHGLEFRSKWNSDNRIIPYSRFSCWPAGNAEKIRRSFRLWNHQQYCGWVVWQFDCNGLQASLQCSAEQNSAPVWATSTLWLVVHHATLLTYNLIPSFDRLKPHSSISCKRTLTQKWAFWSKEILEDCTVWSPIYYCKFSSVKWLVRKCSKKSIIYLSFKGFNFSNQLAPVIGLAEAINSSGMSFKLPNHSLGDIFF